MIRQYGSMIRQYGSLLVDGGSYFCLPHFFPSQELQSQREREVLMSEYNATVTELRDRLAAVAQIPGVDLMLSLKLGRDQLVGN